MTAILAHGLPAEMPLLAALRRVSGPLFFDDTAVPDPGGFPDLGVRSLAGAPVRDANGGLVAAFLIHAFVDHAWTTPETELRTTVARTLATLTARHVAEEQAVAVPEKAVRALG